MCCPGWARLTQWAGIGMASRLHHIERDFSVNRHAQKRLSFCEAGVVSESVKCLDVKSRAQTWTCMQAWRHSKDFCGIHHMDACMPACMPDNVLMAGIYAAGDALHGQRQSPVHSKSPHAKARCRWERVSSGPCRVT